MRRVLAAAVLVAFMPTANAQDKGKSDFSHNAEFRLRHLYEQNESGNTNTMPSHHNGIDERFKLGIGMKANEKFSANATLLHSAAWGQLSTETLGNRGRTTGGDERNFLSVNEAYATWMMAEDFHMKFGRQNYGFGDGSIMSVNDYEAQPYAFDGVVGHFEAEFGKFQAFAFKYRDLSGPQGSPTTHGAATSDPQHNAYGLVFDLKPMMDWLKLASVHVIQDAADGITATSVGTTVMGNQNQNALRYGLSAGFNFEIVDFNLGYEGVNGKNSDVNATTDRKIAQSMYQAQVGFNLPMLMGSRFHLGYHRDSGTKQSESSGAGGAEIKNKTYDPYFYEKHANAGRMDLVGWGNLTDIYAGWTLKPTDNTDVGIEYHMFTKTEKEDTVRSGTYGQNLFNGVSCLPTGTAAAAECKSAIGNEIDLWAEHRYDGGLSMLARVGYFMPGAELKDELINRKAAITQVSLQGKLTF